MQASTTEPIDDLRVREIDELVSPETLFDELPATAAVSATARSARQAIHRALTGADDRMIAVVGPCSIHDQAVALDYARRLAGEAKRLEADLLVVMRVYFEKPR
ncbi:MAG: 3-deoxy-7-phosphoheptulonate synthase, partial [Burkholderiales bacterium]